MVNDSVAPRRSLRKPLKGEKRHAAGSTTVVEFFGSEEGEEGRELFFLR